MRRTNNSRQKKTDVLKERLAQRNRNREELLKRGILQRERQLHSNTTRLLIVILVIIAAAVILIVALANRKPEPGSKPVVQEPVVEAEKLEVSRFVQEYEGLVDQYAARYQVTEYKDYLLAIMEVESGGYGSSDVMQASESADLPMDSLSEEASIEQGCRYFADLLKEAQEQNVDLKTVIQSYNYGHGFISYIAKHGGVYTFELAEAFAKEQSDGQTVPFNNQIAEDTNGGWRYRYGNMFYVPLVEQYVEELREL